MCPSANSAPRSGNSRSKIEDRESSITWSDPELQLLPSWNKQFVSKKSEDSRKKAKQRDPRISEIFAKLASMENRSWTFSFETDPALANEKLNKKREAKLLVKIKLLATSEVVLLREASLRAFYRFSDSTYYFRNEIEL